MGRVGACGDDSAMESFFALLQKYVLDRQRRQTCEELRSAIVTWIERTYHRRRRQARLGKLTPIEFKTINRRNRRLIHSTREPTELGAVPSGKGRSGRHRRSA